MRARRQFNFWPSVVISAAVNLAVFAALPAVKVAPGQRGGQTFVLHHLAAAGPRLPLATPPPAPTATLAAQARPPAPKPVTTATAVKTPSAKPVAKTKPAPAKAAAKAAPAAPGKPGTPAATRSAPFVSPQWRPEAPTSIQIGRAPSGGDGTRAVPTVRRAGGGGPPSAHPFEPGDVNAASTVPALRGLGDPRLEPRGGDPRLDGPPILKAGPGDRGGTPTAPTLGDGPTPGTAGSGDNPAALAPRTAAGWSLPLAPTTPGMILRDRPGPGLPVMPGEPVVITAMPIDPRGTSGGGGGTAAVPGFGGGGPPAPPDMRDASRGGGGSGLLTGPEHPGGVAIGPGVGGTGGGGNGFSPIGSGGGVSGGNLAAIGPMTGAGAPSILYQAGRGDGDGPVVRPGTRAGGPGGPPSDAEPGPGAGLKGGTPGGAPNGKPNGTGTGGQGGQGGDGSVVAGRGKGEAQGSGPTGIVIDTLSLSWPHYPASYDLVVGSANGPRLAAVQVYAYRSVASAKASSRVERGGRHDVLVIHPLSIKFVVGDGIGARQKVIISASEAQKLRDSGLLSQPSRVLTVWKDNIG
jgi:hypothetical protein